MITFSQKPGTKLHKAGSNPELTAHNLASIFLYCLISVFCCASAGPYDNLYSSQLLRAASNNPDLTAQILATQPKQRRQNWYSKVQQIALLLPKYDYPELGNFAIAAAAASDTAASSSSSAQEVVDGLVDDLVTGLLVTGLLDPPQMMLYNFMVNMSTHTVVDNYPEAFWQHVAQVGCVG